ncbi:MAG: WYL domain-containing protein [Lachnospiraceae bacterium]|jgi:predicted DNA-binding transcriptional regulator YafY|nr:WYL domain-containing protein [Lachnospiraceae bacterium]MBR5765874.1 WYL domain-containing protein [Lachnospiraceae bacterium]
MASNHKLKLLYLKTILLEKTDKDHGLTMQEILEELEKNDIQAERKAIYRDLKTLEDSGLAVKKKKSGKEYTYRVEEREFELAELKLLVDAIQSCRFITEKKSRELIGKLEGLCSKNEAGKLQRQVYVYGRIKSMNESIYASVDTIYNAIGDNRIIKFQYGSWNLKKELELKKGGAFYHISPWALAWTNENYYMIGYDSEAGIIKHYRVDKMSRISVTDEKRNGAEFFKSFNLADYTRKNISMYEGEERTVTIEIENEILGVFIDRFGKNEITVIPGNNGKSTIRFTANINPQLIGWIFSLGEKARIIGPASVVKSVKDTILDLNKMYTDK